VGRRASACIIRARSSGATWSWSTRSGPPPCAAPCWTARATESRKTLKRLLRAAEYEHRFDLTELDRSGAPRALQDLLDIYVRGSGLTGSELEARFLDLIAAHGLPAPEVQRDYERYRVDFVWPDFGLIVETDGRSAHDRSIAYVDDRARDRQLKLAGLDVLRYTWTEVVHDAATVADELRQVMRISAGRISRR